MSDPRENDEGRAEQDGARKTTVGGQPPGSSKPMGNVPRGIEVLVKKASVDPAFRALLMRQRAEAAKTIGLELSQAEVQMLNSYPADQLDTVISNTKVPAHASSAFLGNAAAIMLLALGAVLIIPELGRTRGAEPDFPPPKDTLDKASEADDAPSSTTTLPPGTKEAPHE